MSAIKEKGAGKMIEYGLLCMLYVLVKTVWFEDSPPTYYLPAKEIRPTVK